MRGSKTGLEQLIRQRKAPNLLDIDGDVCHHLHNASQKMCLPFNDLAEDLFKDLHLDFQYSTDLRDQMSEVCELMGLSFTMPARFIKHW